MPLAYPTGQVFDLNRVLHDIKKQPPDSSESCSRVRGGTRTHDNQNQNLALYQLNYAHHVRTAKIQKNLALQEYKSLYL